MAKSLLSAVLPIAVSDMKGEAAVAAFRNFSSQMIIASSSASKALNSFSETLKKSSTVDGMRIMSVSDMGDKIRGATIERMWIDEVEHIHARNYEKILADKFTEEDEMTKKQSEPMSSEATAALETAVERINAHFKSWAMEDEKATLLGPGTLTVEGAKGFRKRNHIGGESFIYKSARIGAVARGARIIVVLKPDFAAEYTHVEMSDTEAMGQLDNFRGVMREALGTDFVEEMKRIRAIDDTARDEVAALAKMNEYKDFGAW